MVFKVRSGKRGSGVGVLVRGRNGGKNRNVGGTVEGYTVFYRVGDILSKINNRVIVFKYFFT